MKTRKKGLLGLIAIAALAFAPMASPAYAVDNVDITVDDTATGNTYVAYQIFTGVPADDTTTLTQVAWGAANPGAATAGKVIAAYNAVADPDLDQAASASSVADAIGKLSSENAVKFATQLGQALKDVPGIAMPATGDPAKPTASVVPGYYIILQTAKDDAFTGYSSPLLKVAKDITVTPKRGDVTSDKKVWENTDTPATPAVFTLQGDNWGDTADYETGDNVPFRLHGTISTQLNAYTKYKFQFNDTLADGFTLNQNSIKVYIGDQEVTAGNFTTNVQGQSFTVGWENMLDNGLTLPDTFAAGADVYVTYTALLDGDAIIGDPGNENKLTLTHSSNPADEGGEDTTPEDKVWVFTYEIDVTKVDSADAATKIEGAKFKLWSAAENGKCAVLNAGTYRIESWTETAGDCTELSSDAQGLFNVKGVDSGTYYLEETSVPEPYQLPTARMQLVVTATTTVDDATQVGKIATLVLDSSAANVAATPIDRIDPGIVAATITNTSSTLLPETGGIGTTIFTVVGLLVMAGAAGGLVIRNRRKEQASA